MCYSDQLYGEPLRCLYSSALWKINLIPSRKAVPRRHYFYCSINKNVTLRECLNSQSKSFNHVSCEKEEHGFDLGEEAKCVLRLQKMMAFRSVP